MSDYDYHMNTVDGVTKTQLATFIDSREDYYMRYIERSMPMPETTLAMSIGTILHKVLLEGKALIEVVAVYPSDCLKSNGALNPKPADEFRKANGDKICVKDEDNDKCIDVLVALLNTDLFQLIKAAHSREELFESTYHERRIKCKPDFVGELDDRCCIYDLKFVAQRGPKAFGRTARNFRYWLQDAHYSQVMRFHTDLPIVFRFAAVETSKPYRVDWYEYDLRSREIATEVWANAMRDLIECEAKGDFRDNHKHTLTLSPWDVGAGDDGELVEVVEA